MGFSDCKSGYCAGHQHHPVSAATWHFIIPTTTGRMSSSDPTSLAGRIEAIWAGQSTSLADPAVQDHSIGLHFSGSTRSSTSAAIKAATANEGVPDLPPDTEPDTRSKAPAPFTVSIEAPPEGHSNAAAVPELAAAGGQLVAEG